MLALAVLALFEYFSMTGPNHIAGGIVFTGVFASLWNVNIFSTYDLILWTCFASLLPDIDHTKSPVGKMFYPLARWLDRRFGHRTITHSFAFLFIISLVSASIENVFSEEYKYSIILFFAVFSHFLLDMFTIQGIPLFYPFAKNPCVIPANPQYRMRTGSKRAETSVFIVCLLLLFSCADLFKNGFWTSYNRAFGTLKHLHIENLSTDRLLKVEYKYKKENKMHEGTAFLVNSEKGKSILFDQGIFILDKEDISTKIEHVKPLKTEIIKTTEEISFFGVNFDSLQVIIKNKIVSGTIQASKPVTQIENNIKKTGNLIKLEYAFNPEITMQSDTSKETIRQKIEEKEIKLSEEKKKHLLKIEKIETMLDSARKLEKKLLATSDIYDINSCQKKLISLRKRIAEEEEKRGIYKPNTLLVYQIEKLKEELFRTDDILFSGVLTEIEIPMNIKAVAIIN